jgi:excinuclease UvrABC nuclease subunit
MQNIKDYYLIIEKVIDLPSPKRNLVMELYKDMLHYHNDKRFDVAISYFNTLEMSGYIINRQEVERIQKLDILVDEAN